jgi:TRAP-type C4-dicarboxylate transport system substrate-binding protein
MRMRTYLTAAAVAAMLVIGVGARAETVLTFNQWLPESHPIQVLVNAWAKDVAAATNGRVKIQNTASSLGPPNRQFDLARDGVVDITWMLQGYTPGRFVTSEAAELPFLGNSTEALSVAYWRTHAKLFEKAKEYEGVKVLSVHVHPPGHIYSTTKPLRTVEDLNGLKLRVINPVTAKILETLGGTAVSAPATKTYELVSRGVVDGTFTHDESLMSFKVLPFLKHGLAFDGGIYNTAFALVINQGSWDKKLSAEDRKAMEPLTGEAFAKRVGIMWDAMAEEARKAMSKEGTQVVRVTGEPLNKLKSRLAFIEAEWVQRMSKAGVDGAEALKMMRAEAASYKR